jgi:hypothetical protein
MVLLTLECSFDMFWIGYLSNFQVSYFVSPFTMKHFLEVDNKVIVLFNIWI